MKDTTAQKWIDVLVKLEKKVDELEKKVTDNNGKYVAPSNQECGCKVKVESEDKE